MDLRILDGIQDSALHALRHPESLPTHHLIIAAMAAGYLLSLAMRSIPAYFRPVCRYTMLIALMAVLREDIAQNMPVHRDLFAKVNEALEEVVR